jgi:hypothetical protein
VVAPPEGALAAALDAAGRAIASAAAVNIGYFSRPCSAGCTRLPFTQAYGVS